MTTNKKLADEVDELKEDIDALAEQYSDAVEKITKLREALDEYGEHQRECTLFSFEAHDPEYGGKRFIETLRCTCGLAAALKGEG